jgi:hypothetical protein
MNTLFSVDAKPQVAGKKPHPLPNTYWGDYRNKK